MPRNPEVMFAEAVSELTHRLELVDQAEPGARAQAFVQWMVREGWRPVGFRVEPDDPNRPAGHAAPPNDYQAAREALKGGVA